jgi:hypothetical protein
MMIAWYNGHKSYMLVDIDTNKVSLSRDVVVDEKFGLSHASLGFKIIEKLVVNKDSGVKLQAAPPQRENILSMRSLLG